MSLTMVNSSAEVIVVGQVDTFKNFCPNMVRFRMRPDFLVVFIFFFFFFFFLVFRFFFLLQSLLLYKLNLKLCVILKICLFLMLSNEI